MNKPVAHVRSQVGELSIVYRDPKTLKAYGRNARTHSAAQVDQIRASIREFGFTNPILLKDDDETIGAGHGRQLAAIAEGLTSVPTITLHGLSVAQWRAYVIADNKIALNAGWDESILRLEMGELASIGFDLAPIGFSLDELKALSKPEKPPGPVGSLGDRFMIVPFSVLNAREGVWQDRKRSWLALGIQSELGRGANALDVSASMAGITDPAAVEEWNRNRRKADASPNRKANSIPGGGQCPHSNKLKTGGG